MLSMGLSIKWLIYRILATILHYFGAIFDNIAQ